MDDLAKLFGTICAIMRACEDYKELDAMSDREAMQAESISYNSIKDEINKFKQNMEGK